MGGNIIHGAARGCDCVDQCWVVVVNCGGVRAARGVYQILCRLLTAS